MTHTPAPLNDDQARRMFEAIYEARANRLGAEDEARRRHERRANCQFESACRALAALDEYNVLSANLRRGVVVLQLDTPEFDTDERVIGATDEVHDIRAKVRELLEAWTEMEQTAAEYAVSYPGDGRVRRFEGDVRLDLDDDHGAPDSDPREGDRDDVEIGGQS